MNFIFAELNQDRRFIYSEEDLYHLVKVKRIEIDEVLKIVADNTLFLCKVTSINPFDVQVTDS
jgi:16S rRNA U1498 N3-methylase RsmE